VRYEPYRGRTAPLTSKHCILYMYSTNIGSEYFNHGIHSPFFPLQNAVCFIILTVWFLYYSHFIYRGANNSLTSNDPNSGRTAPLTSKSFFNIFIQQI